MSNAINRGLFTEYTRTPEEKATSDYRRRVRKLEATVAELTDVVNRLNIEIQILKGDNKDE